MTNAAYVNYLNYYDVGRVRAAYGPQLGPPGAAERRYDPDNLFRLNQSIDPRSE